MAMLPVFAPAVGQACPFVNFDCLLGDAAFDAEAHHVLAREGLGIRLTITPVNRRRAVRGRYRGPMERRFLDRQYRDRVSRRS